MYKFELIEHIETTILSLFFLNLGVKCAKQAGFSLQ